MNLLHNRDYVKCLRPVFGSPSSVCPARPAPRRASALRQGGDHPSPQTQGAHFARGEYQRPCRFGGAKCRPVHRHQDAKAWYSLSATLLCGKALRGVQHSCGSARYPTPPTSHSAAGSVVHRSSKVRLRRGQTWPLFREGLQASALTAPARRPSRASRIRPSASAPVRWRSVCPSVPHLTPVPTSVTFPLIPTASSSRACRKHVPASHTLRRYARISAVAKCIYSWACARSRRPSSPASPPVPRSLPWAVPAQAPEAVYPPHRPLSLSAAGSLGSPVRGPAKASGHPTHPDRLRGQRSTAFRALGHLETQRPASASGKYQTSTTSPASTSAL